MTKGKANLIKALNDKQKLIEALRITNRVLTERESEYHNEIEYLKAVIEDQNQTIAYMDFNQKLMDRGVYDY
ncbi:MAG: hypothetical protein GWN62_18800 [Aliifodinibius sp.]|nr:hypothetical protein [Fodinibius sp.]